MQHISLGDPLIGGVNWRWCYTVAMSHIYAVIYYKPYKNKVNIEL